MFYLLDVCWHWPFKSFTTFSWVAIHLPLHLSSMKPGYSSSSMQVSSIGT